MVSASWGLNVIRTVWLGLSFLIILAGAASFRFAFGHFDAANASGIARSDDERIVVIDTKSYPSRAPQISSTVLKSVNIDQSQVGLVPSTGIVPSASQDRREPASLTGRKVRNERSKRRRDRSRAIANKFQAVEEAKSCQLADFDALRWAFSLPTGCHI